MARLHLGLRFAAACIAFAGGPGARAATFDVVRSNPDIVTLLDPSAVEPVGDGKVRRAWSVSVQRNLVSGGPQQPGYVRILNEYDCPAWKIHWRTFQVYSRFGELVLRKENADPAWTPADATFEAAAGARIVCQGAGTGSVYTSASIGQLVVSLMQAWDAEAPLPPLQPVAPPAKKKPPPPKHRDKVAARR